MVVTVLVEVVRGKNIRGFRTLQKAFSCDVWQFEDGDSESGLLTWYEWALSFWVSGRCRGCESAEGARGGEGVSWQTDSGVS